MKRRDLGPWLALTALTWAAPGTTLARSRGPLRTQPVDMVVIHATGGPTCDAQGRPIWVPAGELADNLRQIEAHPRLGVHWMIDRDGTVHAGAAGGSPRVHV